ncbi:relaxase/mobilization nuclease domain-containing protein [Siphonobacter curvatus]|uniref:MobA/VirD2-like nuclease domain-containing protein n=1 Tax=Siphonobacter curvatus TaxID=2094562 RepID=A0A2S7IEU9_9BACT|nr:relaxase/mobilization nuclease domain-containing protein [Siphonobacter curvatus]PQA53188.1 hypothetical protein C5O19_24990 [Siphonobacter curvatus]
MVAIMSATRQIQRALHYNEQKVAQGQAQCLDAGYYPRAAETLSLSQKRLRLQQRAELNKKVKKPYVHLTLNFHPKDALSPRRLKQMAEAYLERIGYARQPYLVYQHHDVAHPHLHVLTTNITAQGRRINAAPYAIKQAAQHLELTWGLIPARQARALYPAQTPTLAATVAHIRQTYAYTSLVEFNAILQGYALQVRQRNPGPGHVPGLYYQRLDGQGQSHSVPIPASKLPGKPTLAALEKQFAWHALQPSAPRALENKLRWCLERSPSLSDFLASLRGQAIQAVLTDSALVYVDHGRAIAVQATRLSAGLQGPGLEKAFQLSPTHLQQGLRARHVPELDAAPNLRPRLHL